MKHIAEGFHSNHGLTVPKLEYNNSSMRAVTITGYHIPSLLALKLIWRFPSSLGMMKWRLSCYFPLQEVSGATRVGKISSSSSHSPIS